MGKKIAVGVVALAFMPLHAFADALSVDVSGRLSGSQSVIIPVMPATYDKSLQSGTAFLTVHSDYSLLSELTVNFDLEGGWTSPTKSGGISASLVSSFKFTLNHTTTFALQTTNYPAGPQVPLSIFNVFDASNTKVLSLGRVMGGPTDFDPFTLTPGSYTLDIGGSGLVDSVSPSYVDFLKYSVTVRTVSGDTFPILVPMPAAVWGGLTMLLPMMVLGLRRRRPA